MTFRRAGSSDLRLLEETTELAGARLAIGFRRTAREQFRHQPPSALEIEGAIAAIEDEIALAPPPAGQQLAPAPA